MPYDYAGWLARAQAFVRGIGAREDRFAEVRTEVRVEPPVTPAELGRIAERRNALDSGDVGSTGPRALPTELARFYTEGCGGCDCHYVCDGPDDDADALISEVLGWQGAVYGGPVFFPAGELPDAVRSCREWAEETWVADDPEALRFWRAGLPFARIENGDYLALDVSHGGGDPPVLYLSHDDASLALAPSFTAFLDAWEKLCYLGPEVWLLDPFLRADGQLDPGTPSAARLRRLLMGTPAA
ncbi:MAG TPA: SMI1/KNR4 family protein [Longimicrobium sp.]|jgi:hypothetical protein